MATNAMGTTFCITPSGGSKTEVGKLSAIGEIAPESEEVDVTTLDSPGGYREYMQGVKSAGELELEGFFDANDAGQAALIAAYASGAEQACEIAFPDGTTVTFQAFVKGYTIGAAEVDQAVAFGAKLRVTGAVTVA